MPQTTAATNAIDAEVEVSTNGTTYTNISGYATSIKPGEAKRKVGQAWTLEGDTAIVLSGKREVVETEVMIVYTEESSGAFEVVRAAFEAAQLLYVRYKPRGGETGEFVYTSGAGVIHALTYPDADGESAGPIMAGFKTTHLGWTKTAAV